MATQKEMLEVERIVALRIKQEEENLNKVVKSRRQAIKEGKKAEVKRQASQAGQTA